MHRNRKRVWVVVFTRVSIGKKEGLKNMRIDKVVDNQGNEYTSFMGSGVEVQRLIKKLWKDWVHYDFSFCTRPQFNSNKIYQIHVSYNEDTSKFDVSVCGQETVIAILANSDSKVLSTKSYSYGE